MRKSIVAALAALAFVLGAVLVASAHTNTDHSANCPKVRGSFAQFPNQKNNIQVRGDDGDPVVASFTGTSGNVEVSWQSLGVDTSDGEVHTYVFSWAADGGGQAGPFNFDAADCSPDETTTTTTVPETTTTTEPDRPVASTKPRPVVVSPSFTG